MLYLSELRSYYDLMEHRKEEHPSFKKCRYITKGECMFSSNECWYLHEDPQNLYESESQQKKNVLHAKRLF